MKIHDVSLPIAPDMLTWPGDPGVEVEPTSRLARGEHANVSLLRLGTHTGTHVDPPLHFIDGAPAIDEVPLDALFGPATVADLTAVKSRIGPDEVAALPDAERVLLKTRNSELWRSGWPVAFPDDYVCLTPAGAEALVARGVRLVGTDFLSIEERGAPGHPVHVTLLRAGVVIVEGLDLSRVEAGRFDFACLPLKIADGDGAPARACLIER